MKDTGVTEGQSVTLKVKVTKKGSKVRWFRNGKELKIDSRNKDVEITQKQLFYYLTLNKVKASDGTEISATYADDETRCNLLIQGRVPKYTLPHPHPYHLTPSNPRHPRLSYSALNVSDFRFILLRSP